MYMTIVSLYYKSLFLVVKLENIMACMYTSYHIPEIYLYVEEVDLYIVCYLMSKITDMLCPWVFGCYYLFVHVNHILRP